MKLLFISLVCIIILRLPYGCNSTPSYPFLLVHFL